MPKNHLDKAIEVVPKFGDRILLFTKKLRLAQYADSTIYNYRLKISQAALYLKKLPDKFIQEDIDDYLSMLLHRNSYSLSYFKHTVFGLKDMPLGLPSAIPGYKTSLMILFPTTTRITDVAVSMVS